MKVPSRQSRPTFADHAESKRRPSHARRSRTARSLFEQLEGRQLLTFSAAQGVNSATFTVGNGPDTVVFSALAQLALQHNTLAAPAGQSFADNFDFDSTVPGSQNSLDSMGTTINVGSAGSAKAFRATIGTAAAPADSLLPRFNLFGNAGSTATVDDSGIGIDTTYSVGPNSIISTGASFNTNGINVGLLGSPFGGNGTGASVTLLTGTGTNLDRVRATSSPTAIVAGGIDTVNVGDGGVTFGILQPLTITGTGPSTSVFLDDSLSDTPTNATLSVAGNGLLAERKLAPADVFVGDDAKLHLSVALESTNGRQNVDFSAGSPIVHGFTFQGSGTTLLALGGRPASAPFASETFDADSSTEGGSLDVDGQHVGITFVASVIDTNPVASLTENIPNATGSSLSIGVGPTINGFATTSVSGNIGSSRLSSLDYANKVGVAINTGSGDDTVAVAGAAILPGTSTLIDGRAGDDTLNYDAGGATVAVTPDPAVPGGLTITRAGSGTLTLRNFEHLNISNGQLQGQAVPPPLVSPAPGIQGVIGVPLVMTDVATFTTTVPTASFSATIDWGDGTLPTAGTVVADAGNPPVFHVEGSHTYATSPPDHRISVIVSQELDSTAIVAGVPIQVTGRVSASATTPVQVTGPILDAQGVNFSTVVGITSNFVVASFTYPGPVQPRSAFNATIDWGDGSASSDILVSILNLTGPTYLVGGVHTFRAFGSAPIRVTIVGPGGTSTGFAASTATVADATLTNANPPGNLPATEGTPLTGVIARFYYPNRNTVDRFFTASINYGDGHIGPGGVLADPLRDGLFDVYGANTYAHAGTYQASITVLDTIESIAPPGSSLTFFRAIDVGGAILASIGTPSVVDAVANQPFTGTVAHFASTSPLALASDFVASIVYGDGSPPSTGVVTQAPDGSFFVTGSHTYAQSSGQGSELVQVGIRELAGGKALTQTATAFVSDAALTAQGATVTAATGLPLTRDVVATFNYGGTLIGPTLPFGGTINWGDGTLAPIGPSDLGALGYSATGRTFVVTGSHTYQSFGTFPVTVTVNAAGSSGVASGTAIVADNLAVSVPTIAPTQDGTFTGVVATITEAGAPGLLSKYAAAINWGDGTPAVPGTIAPGPDGTFLVLGTHTFATPGVFPISVTATNDLSGITTGAGSATVPARPVSVTGQLDQASDGGASQADAITNNNRPRFFGTATPGTAIFLYAIPVGTNVPTLIGSTTTDGSGAWSITSITLADGRYNVEAIGIDPSGTASTLDLILPSSLQGPLTIDTVAPKVAYLQFEPLTGRVLATFQDDRSGLDQGSIVDGSNYSFSFVGPLPGLKGHAHRPGLPLAPAYVVTGASTTTPLAPTDPQAVVVSIDNNQPLRSGFYRITIRSGGVKDAAGNALDGTFYGYFPSGKGTSGGDFVANLSSVHNTVLPALPVGTTASPLANKGTLPKSVFIPTVHATKVRIVGAANTVVALPGQYFPGTFKPAKTSRPKARPAAHQVATSSHAAHDAALSHVSVKQATKANKR